MAAIEDRDWLVIGGPKVVVGSHRPTPSARVYDQLLERFGPGTFNGTWRLLPPEAIRSMAERLDLDDPLLRQHEVFAETDQGGALTWDVAAGESSRVYLFRPRSFSPEPLANAATMLELLALLATKNVASDRAPRVPYFVPARARKRETLRLLGARMPLDPLDGALERALAGATSRVTLLDAESATMLLEATQTIAHLQHSQDEFITLTLDSPADVDEPALLASVHALASMLGARIAST